jgi:hypothetical protein
MKRLINDASHLEFFPSTAATGVFAILAAPYQSGRCDRPIPTNTFSGIRPPDAPAFIVAQLIGAICGLGVAGCFLAQSDETDEAINPEAQL